MPNSFKLVGPPQEGGLSVRGLTSLYSFSVILLLANVFEWFRFSDLDSPKVSLPFPNLGILYFREFFSPSNGSRVGPGVLRLFCWVCVNPLFPFRRGGFKVFISASVYWGGFYFPRG